ncbi:MAG: 4'-phosphopantetheinyl transferase superfamily protein, partial [Zetaproteobacteria bacterium]
ETERAQARAKGDPARRFAMLFAAKEAAAKALGTGFRQGVGPKQIETIHLPTGRPVMRLHGAARRHAERIGARSVLVSLTDDEGVAMAFAVAVAHDAR